MNPTLSMLFFSAVAVGLIKGDAVRLYNLTGFSDPIQQQLQQNDIIYRDYQDGDKLKSGPVYDCADHDEICYVAIDKSDSPHTVVGVIEMHIPDKEIGPKLKELIMAEVPPSKRDGLIGYIDYIFVVTKWRGKGIATNLIEKKNLDDFWEFIIDNTHTTYLTQIRMDMPKVVAMYLIVLVTNEPAIALYKKTGFEEIKRDETWITFVRYLL